LDITPPTTGVGNTLNALGGGNTAVGDFVNSTFGTPSTYNAGDVTTLAPTGAGSAAAGTPAASSGVTGMSGGQLAGVGVAGAGLLANMLKGSGSIGESANAAGTSIANEANTLAAQSTQLQNYVTTGTLPPGVNQVLQQVQKSMTDQIKAKYAQLGMSGSTAETQDINNAALQVQSQGQTEALNLMNQGVSLANLSGQLMTTLMNTNIQQNEQTTQSIGQLAAALAGGGGTYKLSAAA
jgi:hypothetical protein